jgi:hypothetical protein
MVLLRAVRFRDTRLISKGAVQAGTTLVSRLVNLSSSFLFPAGPRSARRYDIANVLRVNRSSGRPSNLQHEHAYHREQRHKATLLILLFDSDSDVDQANLHRVENE